MKTTIHWVKLQDELNYLKKPHCKTINTSAVVGASRSTTSTTGDVSREAPFWISAAGDAGLRVHLYKKPPYSKTLN